MSSVVDSQARGGGKEVEARRWRGRKGGRERGREKSTHTHTHTDHNWLTA